MTAALYARVSTEDQTVEQQVARLRGAAPGAAEFIEGPASGRSTDRPKFRQLQAAISAGLVNEVYVVKLDRLGRSVQDLLEFFDTCEQRKVRVVVLDQAIDTSTAAGRLLRNVLASIAEFESDLIRDRTREAISAIQKGLRKTKTGRPVGRPRMVTPELEERVRALRRQGLKWREIAVRVHLASGTCRKVVMHGPGQTPRVVNTHADSEQTGGTPEPIPPAN